MTAIREFAKVNNHMLNIKMPYYFDYEDVKVVIMLRIDKDDLSCLNDEIGIGMKSAISDTTHYKIFAEMKAQYAN